MADQDASDIQRASSVKIIGSEADGSETNSVGASINREIFVKDTHDNGGIDGVINLTTVAVEGKVGENRKTARKYIIMEALSSNVKWGFTQTTQNFDLFKSQLIMVPIGENTQIWFKVSTGTGSVAFAELS